MGSPAPRRGLQTLGRGGRIETRAGWAWRTERDGCRRSGQPSFEGLLMPSLPGEKPRAGTSLSLLCPTEAAVVPRAQATPVPARGSRFLKSLTALPLAGLARFTLGQSTAQVGWHQRLDGHEFEQAPGAGDGHVRDTWGPWALPSGGRLLSGGVPLTAQRPTQPSVFRRSAGTATI